MPSDTTNSFLHAGVLCDNLFSPLNGDVSLTGTAFQDTATYTCDEGYVLNGDETRECLSTGSWSGEEPVCDRMLCSLNTFIVHIVSSNLYNSFLPWPLTLT